MELVEAGVHISALALIVGAFLLLLAGTTPGIGYSFRSSIEPLLHSVRARTHHSRADLAEISLRFGMVFAIAAGLSGDLLVAVLLCGLLWYSRPMVRRVMREENRMLAMGGLFSVDLVIGFYLPVVAAQVILHNLFVAAALLSVVVAMSWPAGGGSTIPGRTWKLAPVRT